MTIFQLGMIIFCVMSALGLLFVAVGWRGHNVPLGALGAAFVIIALVGICGMPEPIEPTPMLVECKTNPRNMLISNGEIRVIAAVCEI